VPVRDEAMVSAHPVRDEVVDARLRLALVAFVVELRAPLPDEIASGTDGDVERGRLDELVRAVGSTG